MTTQGKSVPCVQSKAEKRAQLAQDVAKYCARQTGTATIWRANRQPHTIGSIRQLTYDSTEEARQRCKWQRQVYPRRTYVCDKVPQPPKSRSLAVTEKGLATAQDRRAKAEAVAAGKTSPHLERLSMAAQLARLMAD